MSVRIQFQLHQIFCTVWSWGSGVMVGSYQPCGSEPSRDDRWLMTGSDQFSYGCMELVEDHWLWYVVWISNTCDPLINQVLQVICSSNGITRLLIPTTHTCTLLQPIVPHTLKWLLRSGGEWLKSGRLVHQRKILMRNPMMVCVLYSITGNHYKQYIIGITLNQVSLQLTMEEADKLCQGEVHVHETSPLCFLQQGLDLEENQWVILPQYNQVTLIFCFSQM